MGHCFPVKVRVCDPRVQIIVAAVVGLGSAVGAFGAAGIASVAPSGADSPLLLAKKMLTG